MKKYLLKCVSALLAFAMLQMSAFAAGELTAKEVAEQTSPKNQTNMQEGENVAADVSEYVDPAMLSVANSLLGVLYEGELFADGTVKRGEFVDTVAKLMKVNMSVATDAVYKDVPADDAYAASIKTALELGWVSAGEYFRPNDEIKINEAVKILVSAAGYAEKAEFSGGFPVGFWAEADELELLDGVKQNDSEKIIPSQARVLLYNLLNAEWSDKAYLHTIYGVKLSEASTGKTILEVFYNILKTEGVINETTYNSLEYGKNVSSAKYIEINGETFTYDNVTSDLLGKYTIAFYDADTTEVVALDTKSENEILVYDLKNLEFESESLIEYVDEHDREDIEISGGVLVYNGKRTRSFDGGYFDKDGYAVFINNDDDEEFEVVHITAYTYMTVTSVDRFNGIITDEKIGYTLNLKDLSEDMIKIYDESGEEINFYGLSTNMVLELIVPEDESFAQIKVVSNQVVGAATGYDDEYLTIDGTKYGYTKHFNENYFDSVVLGKTNTYYLGYDNRVVSFNTGTTKYQYGFVIRVSNEEGNSVARMRMFTQEGKMVVFDLDDNLIVDGIKTNPLTLSPNYDASVTDHYKRMVRYMINSKGKISKLDTPVDYDYSKADEQTADENNELIYYPGHNVSMRYRNNNQTFTGKLMTAKATCFVIPTDIMDDPKKYEAGVASVVLASDTSYTPHVFDIDENGYAGCVMVIGETVTGLENEYIIEKIKLGMNADDEIVKILTCWRGGQYHTLYLPDDVNVTKDSGSELVSGDIVRLKVDSDNNIKNVRVDFDYNKFELSSTVASSNIMATHSNPNFWSGIVYSVADNFVQLSPEKDEFGEYNFSQYALRPVSVNTTNIVRFDCETKTLRPITRDEIKSYKAAKDNCEYIFIRTSYEAPNFVVLYDNHNLK